MGVVRREGDWRLEKVEEGFYEITFQREAQVKVLTPEYQPGPFNGPSFDMIPVREVGSYSEAEGLFEEKAHGPPPFGMDTSGGLMDTGSGLFGSSATDNNLDEGDDPDLTPGVLAFALLVVGGFLIYTQWPSYDSRIFQTSVLLVLGGLAIMGWAGFIHRRSGWSEAIDFLFQIEDTASSSSSSGSTDTTPPAPQRLKEEIIFDRADHHCEWCGERFDGLQVHHIEPRSEGGPNTKRNLVALCPNCHDRADRGGISKTQLRGKVRRILAESS